MSGAKQTAPDAGTSPALSPLCSSGAPDTSLSIPSPLGDHDGAGTAGDGTCGGAASDWVYSFIPVLGEDQGQLSPCSKTPHLSGWSL